MKDTYSLLVSSEEAISPPLAESHRQCFACGTRNHVGLKLHFEIDRSGAASGLWKPDATFRSYPDRIHGGVLATLMDSAIVHALFARRIIGVTAELTIRYLHSVNITDEVLIRGWVAGSRHRMYECRAEVHQLGALAVRASAKFMEMPGSVHESSG